MIKQFVINYHMLDLAEFILYSAMIASTKDFFYQNEDSEDS